MMSSYKSEREWSDLERADKIVLISGILLWALMSFGIVKQNIQNNKMAAKTEIVNHR